MNYIFQLKNNLLYYIVILSREPIGYITSRYSLHLTDSTWGQTFLRHLEGDMIVSYKILIFPLGDVIDA